MGIHAFLRAIALKAPIQTGSATAKKPKSKNARQKTLVTFALFEKNFSNFVPLYQSDKGKAILCTTHLGRSELTTSRRVG